MSLKSRFLALDPTIVGLTFGLTIFGLIVLMSASGPEAFQQTGNGFYYVKHQLLNGVLPGMIGFLIFAFIDYRWWKKFAFFALIVTLGLLVLVYIPGIGLKLQGAYGWVKLGAFAFQPSELVKLTFLIYLAAWLETRQGFAPFVSALGAVMLLLILQPDTGSMTVIVGTALILYFLAGALCKCRSIVRRQKAMKRLAHVSTLFRISKKRLNGG